MKLIISILGFMNGGYMLLDGIFVTLKGKYLGPDKPGPWAEIFNKLNLNALKFGWLFILYGLLWLIWTYSLLTTQTWAFIFGVSISILTLWYLPFGTLISMVILATLLLRKQKLGF